MTALTRARRPQAAWWRRRPRRGRSAEAHSNNTADAGRARKAQLAARLAALV